ncbi:MAG: hypothetical protein Q8P48_06085, partial [Deltaproteobacteria bacterium]|nr:hypothetical protein [Deltaproteobacteria bacterium]
MRSQRNIVSLLKRNHIVIVSLLLAFFSLHLALTDKKEVARGLIVKEVLSVAMSPVQRLLLGGHGLASGVWEGYINLVGVREENERLKLAAANLEDENYRLKEDVSLNSRLRDLLEYKD